MIRRLVRTLLLFTVGPLAALMFKRVLDERRSDRRLATPVTDWPDVPVDPAPGDAVTPDAVTAHAVTPDAVTPDSVTPGAVTAHAVTAHAVAAHAVTSEGAAPVEDGIVFDITPEGLAGEDGATQPQGPDTSGAAGASGVRAWVEPDAGACPIGHPVKVKERSSLYHLPGMVAYGRTLPDRCYAVAEDAERDGFTRARR
jgi:hypothetical protein